MSDNIFRYSSSSLGAALLDPPTQFSKDKLYTYSDHSDTESLGSFDIIEIPLAHAGILTGSCSDVSLADTSPAFKRRTPWRSNKCMAPRPPSHCPPLNHLKTPSTESDPQELDVPQIQFHHSSLENVSSSSPKNSPKGRQKGFKFNLKSPRHYRKIGKKRNRDDFDDWKVEKEYHIDTKDFENWKPKIGLVPDSFTTDVEFEIQRIPEYDKYLSELLEKIDSSHPDFEDLSKAVNKVKSMVREVDLGNAENEIKVENVQDRFPNDDLQLQDNKEKKTKLSFRRKSAPGAVLFKGLGSTKSKSSSNVLNQSIMGKKDFDLNMSNQFKTHSNISRMYIDEGPVQFLAGMQTQDRYMFLFNDLLLIAKQKSSTTFKLKNRVRVCELWIASCLEDVAENIKQPDKSFVLGWPTCNVVATFRSDEDKDRWLFTLNHQIHEEKLKEEPKKMNLKIRLMDKFEVVEIEHYTKAEEVVKMCAESDKFKIPESELQFYQIWVRSGREESMYPLIGHEIPYNINMSHIRDLNRLRGDEKTGSEDIDSLLDDAPDDLKCAFILSHNKKSPKKHSLEETFHKKSKKPKKSPLNFFKKTHKDAKTAKLFGQKLSDVCGDDMAPKPIMDLLTILFREGPYTVGILRKSANVKTTREIRQKLDDGEDCPSEDSVQPLVAGALIKEYLRNLPDSLLKSEYYNDWLNICQLSSEEEKISAIKDVLEKLPPCNMMLLKYFMCVLHHIDNKKSENKMNSYNLAVCIAPSMLRSKDTEDHVGTLFTSLIQCMIDNVVQLFGNDVIHLFGELPVPKSRQDSSTDSDSLHSLLSTNGGSIDSIDKEYMDSSPKFVKNLPSPNLSRDSGLTLSDTQLYEDDGTGVDNNHMMDKRYMRSSSHVIERENERLDDTMYSHSYEGDETNPIPPPRKGRRKISEPPLHNISDHFRHRRNVMAGDLAGRPTSLQLSSTMPAEVMRQHGRHSMFDYSRLSSESLHSVEEEDDERRFSNLHRATDIGTLIKSSSGAHLFLNDEDSYNTRRSLEELRRQKFTRQTSVTSSPPISPDSKYSLSSSRDSMLSESSLYNTPDKLDDKLPPWLPDLQESNIPYKPHNITSQNQDSSKDHRPRGLSHSFSSGSIPQSMRNSNYLNMPDSPLAHHRSKPDIANVSPAINIPKNRGRKNKNSSLESDDTERSPRIAVTYSSASSEEQDDVETVIPCNKEFRSSIRLYTNNSNTSQLPIKQISLYSSGLGSPSSQKMVPQKSNGTRETSVPLRASHDKAILSQLRRNSDSFDNRDRYNERAKMLQQGTAQWRSYEEPQMHKTEYTLNISPIRLPLEHDGNVSDRTNSTSLSVQDVTKGDQSPSSLSSSPRELNGSFDGRRPDKPPSYEEAVHRKVLLAQGMLENISEQESERQREINARARRLYEESQKQYLQQQPVINVQRSSPLSSSQNSDTRGSLEDTSDDNDIYVTIKPNPADVYNQSMQQYQKDPRRIYEESLKRLNMEQQTATSVTTVGEHSEIGRRHSYGAKPYSTLKEYSIDNVSSPVKENNFNHIKSSTPSDKNKYDSQEKLSVYKSPPSPSLHRSKSDSHEHVHKLEIFRQRSPSREDVNHNVVRGKYIRPTLAGSSPPTMKHYIPKASSVINLQSDDRTRDSKVPLKCKNDNSKPKNSDSMIRTCKSTSNLSKSNQNLPWSVKNLRTIYDSDTKRDRKNSSGNRESSHPEPPPYHHPPPFHRLNDSTRVSISSSSSAESMRSRSSSNTSRTSLPNRPQFHKYGPQSVDYSSTDESDCSSHRHLDESSLEELSYTDVSYV